MSHHFDTPTAKEDPRINICDFYLFRGRPGTTVMALTVNPNAGVGAPDTLRDEGIYAFRFDTDRDLREDVTFKVQFGGPSHGDGGEHVRTFAARRATGGGAPTGAGGGLPMITAFLLSDPSLHDGSEKYNRAVPADEVALFSKPIRDFVEKVTALAHSAADPSAYATQLLARLCPSVLPYELDTPAAFTFAAFNGRSLCDDVLDVILTLATNTALGDGVAPDKRLMRPDFPYFGQPHATAANSAKQ